MFSYLFRIIKTETGLFILLISKKNFFFQLLFLKIIIKGTSIIGVLNTMSLMMALIERCPST